MRCSGIGHAQVSISFLTIVDMTMPSAEIFCLALLLMTVGLLLNADFNRRLDSSRIAAVLAIVTIAGADYFFIKAMPFGDSRNLERPAVAERKPAQQRGGIAQDSPPHLLERGGLAGLRGETTQGAASDNAEGAPPGGGEATDAAAGTGTHAAIEGAGRSLRHWLKAWLGRQFTLTRSLVQVRDFKDCDTCPEMVRIPSGVRQIGDPNSDTSDPSGLMPQREMRVWPGFAVARDEITTAQLQAAGITTRHGGACELSTKLHADAPAACVSVQEMESYIDWLNHNTGRRYRLLSATEWDYAARASMADDAGARHMGGGLVEMVADCWPSGVAATRIVAAKTAGAPTTRCSRRVVKDGADLEDKHWQNPASRRVFEADGRSPQVGFRVMRTFDLTAEKGF